MGHGEGHGEGHGAGQGEGSGKDKDTNLAIGSGIAICLIIFLCTCGLPMIIAGAVLLWLFGQNGGIFQTIGIVLIAVAGGLIVIGIIIMILFCCGAIGDNKPKGGMVQPAGQQGIVMGHGPGQPPQAAWGGQQQPPGGGYGQPQGGYSQPPAYGVSSSPVRKY